MKKTKILLLISLLSLTSCTMMGVEVNKGPEDYHPDGDIFTSHVSSSEIDTSTSEVSDSKQTPTGPIMNGLTFEKATPIIQHIKENINAEDYQVARYYTSKFKSHLVSVDKESNITITIENIDSYIDFDDFYYSSSNKKVVNSEINKDIKNYVYKENNAESKLFYDVNIDKINPETPIKKYSTSEAISLEKADLMAKFSELTGVRESANQDLTNLAIEAMLGLKYVKNFFKKVDITSKNENSISFDIEYDEDVITHMTTHIVVNIDDNRLMQFKTETHPIGAPININVNEYDITYLKKEITYPILDGFEKI